MAGTLRGNHEDPELCSKDMLLHRLEDLEGMLLHNLTHVIHSLLLELNDAFQGRHTVQHAFPDSVRRHMHCTHYNFLQVDKGHPYNRPRGIDHSGSQCMVLHRNARNRLHNQQDSYHSGLNKDHQR